MAAGTTHRGRTRSALVGVPMLLAACSAAGGDDTAPPPAAGTGTAGTAAAAATTADLEPVAVPQVAASPVEDGPSGLSAVLDGAATELPEPAVPISELRSGGPPPDGIPPIDEPKFVPATAVDFLADNEPILAVEVDGEARAYPVQILIWHEIVNDTIAGIPVAITYCPVVQLGGRLPPRRR